MCSFDAPGLHQKLSFREYWSVARIWKLTSTGLFVEKLWPVRTDPDVQIIDAVLNVACHCRIKELISTQPKQERPQERVRSFSSTNFGCYTSLQAPEALQNSVSCDHRLMLPTLSNSIKRPKTNRYPSLKGTDPKFRRNHRHALHGTARALVSPKLNIPDPRMASEAITVESVCRVCKLSSERPLTDTTWHTERG